MKIHYRDATSGLPRVAIFKERVEGLTWYKHGEPPSPAARYILEDGSTVQIPDRAWAELSEIEIEDHDDAALPIFKAVEENA